MTTPEPVDRLVTYVSSFDPGFGSRIRGARPDELATLEGLVGRPLPKPYADYLARMGHGNGGLLPFVAGTTDVTAIIDTYREIAATGEWDIPRDCLLVGGDIFPSQELALRPDGAVWIIEAEWYVDRHAATLEHLLWREAFMRYRLTSPTHHGYWMIPRTGMLPAAGHTAGELGLDRCWFSDDVVYCGEADDAAMVVVQHAREGCHIFLAAQDEAAFDQWGDALTDRLGARFVSGGNA